MTLFNVNEIVFQPSPAPFGPFPFAGYVLCSTDPFFAHMSLPTLEWTFDPDWLTPTAWSGQRS